MWTGRPVEIVSRGYELFSHCVEDEQNHHNQDRILNHSGQQGGVPLTSACSALDFTGECDGPPCPHTKDHDSGDDRQCGSEIVAARILHTSSSCLFDVVVVSVSLIRKRLCENVEAADEDFPRRGRIRAIATKPIIPTTNKMFWKSISLRIPNAIT